MYTVYLVDNDTLEIEKTIEAFTQQPDIEVIGSSSNSKVALNEIVALRPNLVVSDLYMRNIGGIRLMNALKASGADCEFVILTHSWSSEAMRDFFQAGGFDFLLKPLDSQAIEDVLSRLKEHNKLKNVCKN